uniref:E3 ubiquitin-protein ligase RNF213 isoform X1 n=1 Tax=Pogona vitticeps TaxID=103695 RepID=A0ABM5FN25_9SAUR
MESGKELRMESFSSLGSSAEQQPPTEEAEKESEESLPEGQGSLSQRKKKKKKKRKHADLERQDSSTTSLSSVSSSVDYPSSLKVAGTESPPKQSPNSEAELTKANTESTGESRDQINSSPLKINQSAESVAENHEGSNDIKPELEHDGKKSTEDQQARGASTGEKVEEESSQKDDTVCGKTGSNKDCGNSAVANDQSLGSILNTQTLVGALAEGVAENISPDFHFDVEPSEKRDAKLSAQGKKQEMKGTKSEMKDSQKTKVEEAAKQQSSASVPKNAKVEEVSNAEKASEKVQQASTPIQCSDQGKMSSAEIKKKQTNQRAKKQGVNKEVKQSHIDFADRITVYFHAILSKDFKFDHEKHKIFIRAGKMSGYEDWTDNICELTCSKDLGEHGHFIEGCAIVNKVNMDRSIPYKYLVAREKGEEYEFIYKHGTMVNRRLFIDSHFLCGKDWHQYDDIVCAKPPENLWNTIKNHMPFWKSSEKDVVKGKELAAREMLENLFSILNPWTPVNVRNFLQQLRQFYVVNSNPMVHEGGGAKKWEELHFGKEQVKMLMLNYLRKVAHDLLNKNSACENASVQNKLRLALIILLLGHTYYLPTSKKDLIQLCILLCLEKPRRDSLNEINSLKEMFSEVKCLRECLMVFCNRCIEEEVQQWLWAIPVLHLFSASGDFECLQMNTQLEFEEKWAGLEGFPFIKLREDQICNKDSLQLMKEKKHLLKGDRALFRSWFSLLPLQYLVEFIPDSSADLLDCLVGTFHRLKDVQIGYMNTEAIEHLLNVLLDIANKQKDILKQDCWSRSMAISLKIHSLLCNKTYMESYKIPVTSAKIVSDILRLAPVVVSGEKEMQCTSANEMFQRLCQETRTWFRKVFSQRLLQKYSYSVGFNFPSELQAWDQFLKVDFHNGEFTEKWKKTLIADLESRIKQEPPIERIRVYGSRYKQFEELDCMICKTFEDCAMDAINSAHQENRNLLGLISTYDLMKLGKLVSAVITKAWPTDEMGKPRRDVESVLNHLLVWSDIKHVFTFNGTDGNILDQLTEEAQELMAIADSIYIDVSKNLETGHILVKYVDLISEHKKQFLSICEWKSKHLLPGENTNYKLKLERVLERRRQEAQVVRKERQLLGVLLDMCRKVQDYVKVDIDEVEQKYSEDLASKALDEVVNVKDAMSHGDGKIETYYHLNPDLKKIYGTVGSFKDSHVFQYCWEWAAKQLASKTEDLISEEDTATLSLDEVPLQLFEPCCCEFHRLYLRLRSGDLTFAEVDVLFKDFTNLYEELRKDFQKMCSLQSQDRGEWIKKRVEQIQQYHELHLAVDAAKVIDKVREGLNLSGDFSVLQHLLNFTVEFKFFQQEKISSMTPALMHAKKLLQNITELRRSCLEELAVRRDFVLWVKEALTDINELKVFVDLASISAGENDMDVDRVACFHDAVLGYSSLLYELKQESGFEEFMECLEKLWKALENDRNLTKKLRDSARYLEWLKTIKESHGSVELSSISLATTINKNGIYNIRAPSEGGKVSLDSVLWLSIPESHGGQLETRQYSLEELRELMNKLMLMSGKVEQSAEVDRFSEVFSGVQRLALSFIDLYSAGNKLFRSWMANIYCSPQSEFCIEIDFNLNTNSCLLGNGEVTKVLPEICRKMESFLERWNRFISEKRSQYFYLNYYTAEQLVFLCRELGSESPTEAALMMLSFIKQDCSKKEAQVSRQVVSRKPKRSFVDLFGEVEMERELTAQLECIWESYMENIGSFLPGYLDIESLGVYLNRLADLERRSVTRTLPPGLHTGRPNLILCPRSEILASALAVYMNSPGEMLPSYDEVLLCTPHTSFEQVALFLRRCLTPGCKGRKIYTLLFADELSYDVGYRSEELFQSLHLKHKDDYCLVILCNCEREHCYVPSVFSQYKVHMIPHQPLSHIQSYLGNHYRVMQPDNSSGIFKDQMCVGIVSSKRAGVGKSLYVKRLHEKMEAKMQKKVPLITIRLIDSCVDEGKVLKSLLPFLHHKYQKQPVIFHFDITSSVQTGISEFLFKLLVLHYLADTDGKLWLRNQYHLYVVEILEASPSQKNQTRSIFPGMKYNFLDVFPKITCRPPKEVLEWETQEKANHGPSDPSIDQEVFCSEAFQRPFQYLRRFSRGVSVDTFQYKKHSVEGTPAECLQLLLIHCGVIDPSWSELRNFAWFLNLQLRNCETSVFCNLDFIQDTLQGFKNFVVGFMILMAKDFATPSLNISDESPGRQVFAMEGVTEEDLAPFRIRKKWESEPHPYIFFNEDSESMTFIGFHLHPNANGGIDAINSLNGRVIKSNVMTAQLYQGLVLQKVPFNIDFDALPRHEKIEKLCMVLGISWPIDPDETYELTTDNILKILAIEMRFRCGIPVVLMGETGCGKTRLIKFLCELRRSGVTADNMKLVKVHGGTTADAIYAKVKEAQDIAVKNTQYYNFDTILFFDEANTTEAISSIKEVLCDRTVEGKPLAHNSGLQIIAACNPYRKHTNRMIERLESAGLGYRVKAEETKDKLGSIPLRQLVYRVHALPPSMIPLVWDFGQLNNFTEKLYIQQIVQRLTRSIEMSGTEIQMITDVLFESQKYMRRRNDECSFISLRDVERCVEVFKWFHNHNELLMKHLEKYFAEKGATEDFIPRDKIVWSLVLSVGVCYHASLEKKQGYRRVISEILPKPYDNEKGILEEIDLVQDLFLSGAPLRKTIAKNLALKENVFMMVICIELKIPLFLIGKPGSSKSLAKTIVADAMQGHAAYSELYKDLKQIHLVSFQCSPHSTPEGIISTFKHCARFQEGKNLKEYVSVVVLDEIGLAEDSPKMPLKTLHPLLEDGCVDDDPLPYKKVGFIGISNWALDPAKMNRGIFVSRGDPSKEELIESAKGICSSERAVLQKVERFFRIFANAYGEICKAQSKEFFGLRDYYSLIKMTFALTKKTKRTPAPREIAEVILRNFSGKTDVEALNIFMSKIPEKGDVNWEDVSTIDLVKQNIYSDYQDGECRYLLVLTENYAALQILQQVFFKSTQQPEIIFGSSFPKDQEYTQICRNINRVKMCMETGQMVILLNLQNLYESLYDALNQYYVQLAGQKYVDLGLGTHRVKCRVHPKFRLIVIEEKEVVYNQFPIPLINRLEKHCLDINTVLDKWQKQIVEELKAWVHDFTAVETEKHFMGQQKYTPSDVFVGYHSDTCASVVLQVTEKVKMECHSQELMQKVKEQAKLVLLNCATPDSVIRLGNSQLGSFQADDLARVYFQQHQHTSLADFLHVCLGTEPFGRTVFTEITTFSRLLTAADAEILEAEVQGKINSLRVLFLQQFDTEHSFLKEIRNFLYATYGSKILIIQTDFENGSLSAQLVASAKYSAVNEISKIDLSEASVFVFFITKLSRVKGGNAYVGFHGGLWQSLHIDDLRKSRDMVSDVTLLRSITISQLFSEDMGASAEKPTSMMMEGAEEKEEEMEVEVSATPREGTLTNEVLDTTILIRSCVQSAVGMLRDQNEGASRSTKRIEILLSLLCEEDDMKASFLKIVKSRLLNLLKKQEDNSYNMKEWVLREALNLNALQEAGTFRQTLWKRVQSVVTPFLAYIVSVIDRDCNMNLLDNSETEYCVKALWMFIFNDQKLLNIPYVMGQSSSRTETILVQNYFEVSADAGNNMPFSWRIKDYLEDIWVQAQYITDNKGPAEKFVYIFHQTSLGTYIASLSEGEKEVLFHCYLTDFLLLAMGVSSGRELILQQTALLSCIEEMKAASPTADKMVPPLPWIHLAYHQFKSRLQNLSRILAVYPDVFAALSAYAEEGGYMPHDQMVLDLLAAVACTEMLEENMSNFRPQGWLQKVKEVQMPVELVCTENYLQSSRDQCYQLLQKVKNQWNRIFSMSLFVEHVLLGAEKIVPEMQDLVKNYASQLGNCFQGGSEIKTHSTFTAVMKVIRHCKEDISSAFCRYGLKPCPICLGDPGNPVSLPCDHVFCHTCIKQWLVPGQMLCPLCLSNLPDDYTLTISKELSVAIERNAQFRKFCNSFFLDLVSTMCFKDNEPPEKAVIQELLNLLFVRKEFLRSSGSCNVHTKSLSPFDDVVDKTPVIRSVVLKLLLKYSFDHVKGYLQKYLSQVEKTCLLEKEDKIELYTLFVNCFEDSMWEKLGALAKEIQINHLKEDTHFLTSYSQRRIRSRQTSQESSIEFLQGLARLRLCLDRAAELLFELQGKSDGNREEEKQSYLQSVKQFCCQAQNEWYRVYLVRKLTNQYGMEFTQRLSSERQYQWIFPSEIIEQQQVHQPSQIDRFLIHGKSYRDLRNALGKAIIECHKESIEQALKTCSGSKAEQAVHFLLAVFREFTSLYASKNPSLYPKPKQRDILKEFVSNSKVLPSPELEAFADSLTDNTLPSLALSPQDSSHKAVVIEMAIHTAAVFLSRENRILEPLRNLAFMPNTMQNAFLPTMAEDLLAQAVGWQATAGLQWYTCPNGHPCTIGECGQPMETSRCVDCGVEIGGRDHRPLPNFHKELKNNIRDRTQTGHVLGDPSKREAKTGSERKMSPAVLILIRLLTHLALFLGAAKDPQSVLQIIKPHVQNPVSFLMQHIHKDLEQLMNTLGKSADETTNVIHLILCSLLKDPAGHWPVGFDGQLSTKEYRNKWEEIVAQTIVLPQLELLDKSLLELNQQISQDERISSNPIVKIVYGDPALFLSRLPPDSLVHCSRMWSCRKRISVEYLGHVVQQKGGKDTVPVLWKFLQKEAELRLVKFLPDILALQKDLVKKFQNISEVEHHTIKDFVNSLPEGGLRHLTVKRVNIFLDVWNKLKSSLENNGEIKLPRGYCDDDLSLATEFEVLLPRRRGLGLCSTALASYLISLHNDFVYTILNYTTEAKRYSVSPTEVADLHVITYEVERDLIPLILSNCQYSVEKGREALQELDLEKIQQQVINRFLQGKPLITLTGIPTLVYRHDRNYEHIFKDIKNNLDQTSLPNSTISMISGELHSYSDICEALYVTEITLGFLAMAGGEPEVTLAKYVEDTLKMGSQTSAHILKVLSRCHLKHTTALWQLLSSHKSEHLLHLKRDPFADVMAAYKEELTPEHTRLLNAFLIQGGLESFLQELHEMIILKLKPAQAGEEFNPTWSLKDTLISYLERKESHVPEELEDAFPDEIQLSQCVAAWKVAAALKWDQRLP